MSLNYKWFSTMWGPYIFAGAAGSSMSLLVLVITALRKAGYLQEVVTLEHYHIMGKWMLAFSVFWAYIGFSQYMLYWYANIPEETQYFIQRNTESWWSPELAARRRPVLCAVRDFAPALDQESIRISSVAWRVGSCSCNCSTCTSSCLPALHRTGVHLSMLGLCSRSSVLARRSPFFTCALLARLRSFPMRDPRLIESLRLTN